MGEDVASPSRPRAQEWLRRRVSKRKEEWGGGRKERNVRNCLSKLCLDM